MPRDWRTIYSDKFVSALVKLGNIAIEYCHNFLKAVVIVKGYSQAFESC